MEQSAYGEWEGVARAALSVAAAASGMPAGAELINLILSLAGATAAQETMLSSIRQDTKLLREEPFRTSRTMLAEARRVGPTDPRFRGFLDKCLDSLYRAHSLTASASESALIEFDIAAVYLATGKRADAAYWAERSQFSARATVDVEIIGKEVVSGLNFRSVVLDRRPKPEKTEDLWTKLKGWWSQQGLGVPPIADPGAAVLAVAALLTDQRRQRAEFDVAIASLQDLVAFVNTVEAVGAALNAVPSRPFLRLEIDRMTATIKQLPPGGA